MGAHSFEDLIQHVGHRIVCVAYGDTELKSAVGAALECETCHQVLMDFNKRNDYCPKCGQHFAVHNDDGSCVEDRQVFNYYHCLRCDITWKDKWDCSCNDRCPKCNVEIEPYKSEDC